MDPYFLLIAVSGSNSESDPFFSDFKDAKKKISQNLPAGTLSSVIKIIFLLKILCKNFILHEIFQSTQHLYKKREGSGPEPDLYI